MSSQNSITQRRSIRIYKKDPVPEKILHSIFEKTILAPSAHNNQPWEYIVLRNDNKDSLIKLLEEKYLSLVNQGIKPGSLKRSIGCIKRAPIFVLVFNKKAPFVGCLKKNNDIYEWMLNLQSLGGAIQTMLLAAQEYDVGSLWTCEILYADQEITSWLQTKNELIGGVCLGYADESPEPRPRIDLEQVVKWM